MESVFFKTQLFNYAGACRFQRHAVVAAKLADSEFLYLVIILLMRRDGRELTNGSRICSKSRRS